MVRIVIHRIFRAGSGRTDRSDPFRAAARLAVSRDLIYCEGFAAELDSPVPIHHAWVVEADNGRVVAVTTPRMGAYLGVPFRPNFVAQRLLTAGRIGAWSLLGDAMGGSTILSMTNDELAAIIRSDPTGWD